MSPRKFAAPATDAVTTASRRMWLALGISVRESRLAKRWSVQKLAETAGVSPVVVYRVEAGSSASTEAAVRIAHALGLRLSFELTDPRRRTETRRDLSSDPVHSAMGEFQAGHFRGLGIPTGIDEPYQHYQFAGRADVVAWDLAAKAFLHIENRTRFPDFQEMAGSFNAKRAYLAEAIRGRLGVGRWNSQTHIIAALWTSEVLHALRCGLGHFGRCAQTPPMHSPPGGAAIRQQRAQPRASSSSTRSRSAGNGHGSAWVMHSGPAPGTPVMRPL
jgi:transcriptional regulator with XRE-family HTH domain